MGDEPDLTHRRLPVGRGLGRMARTIADHPADAFTLAPERMTVQGEWMSEYQPNLLGVGVAPTEIEKLVPYLRNKARYELFFRILQLY